VPTPSAPPSTNASSQPTDTLINLDGPDDNDDDDDEGPEDPEPSTKPKPTPAGPPRVKVSNMHPELDRLLASGDGIDTFGNTGDMRLGPNAAMWHQMMQQQRTGQAPAMAGGTRSTSNPFTK
jgi:hypothetical protein